MKYLTNNTLSNIIYYKKPLNKEIGVMKVHLCSSEDDLLNCSVTEIEAIYVRTLARP